jgi:hypothetical protein
VTTCFVYTIACLDPEDWGKDHVQQWLKWTQDEFSLLDPVNPAAFDFDGKQLVSLTKEDFVRLTSESTGDIIHGHLTVLRKGELPGRDVMPSASRVVM